MRDELRGLGRHMGLHTGKTPFRCPPRGREAANLFGSTFGLRDFASCGSLRCCPLLEVVLQ